MYRLSIARSDGSIKTSENTTSLALLPMTVKEDEQWSFVGKKSLILYPFSVEKLTSETNHST